MCSIHETMKTFVFDKMLCMSFFWKGTSEGVCYRAHSASENIWKDLEKYQNVGFFMCLTFLSSRSSDLAFVIFLVSRHVTIMKNLIN